MAPFFVAAGTRYEVSLQPLSGAVWPPLALHAVRVGLESAPPDATPDPMAFANRVRASPVLASRIDEPADLAVVETRPSGGRAGARQPASTAAAKARRPSSHVVLLATATVIAEGVRQTDLAAAKTLGAGEDRRARRVGHHQGESRRPRGSPRRGSRHGAPRVATRRRRGARFHRRQGKLGHAGRQ